MTNDHVDWHMPLPAKRLLAGKMTADTITYIPTASLDDPELPQALLKACTIRHANKINHKNGFYIVFGAIRHIMPVYKDFNYIPTYISRKKAWVTKLNDEQVETVIDIVNQLQQSQIDLSDPIIFEKEVLSVKCPYPHFTTVIILWAIRKSCKKDFKFNPKSRKSIEEIDFGVWQNNYTFYSDNRY